MSTQEPNPRYHAKEASLSIINKFNWAHESWMQDWPLEISGQIDLLFCLREYPKLKAEDEKFLLMKGILYALDEVQGEDFKPLSQKVAKILKSDFHIHKYTIYYWTLYGSGYLNEHEGFTITPLMQEIWNSQMTLPSLND